MKARRHKDAATQSEVLDFATLRPGGAALDDSALSAALRGRKILARGITRGPVAEDLPSPGRAEGTELPRGWRWVALSAVVIKGKPTNPLAEPEREFAYVDVSSISRDALSIKEARRMLGKDAPSRARKLIRAGDVIFATVRPSLRRVAVVPPDLDGEVCSTAFCVIRANPETADPGFLFFATVFEDFVKRVSEHQGGSSYPAVTDGQVLAERIPYPSLPEQRAITSVLRTVQGAKEACERVLAATRQLKQSLLHHLFTYGPVPFTQADHVRLQETEIGQIPDHWSVAKLGDFAHLAQYGLSLRGNQSGSYPILRMNNLQEGKVIVTNIQGGLQYVELDNKMLAKFRLAPGDLLFNRTNSFELVGKISIFELPGTFVFASYIVRLQLDGNRLHARFANYCLNMPSTQARLKFLASRGVSQSNINASKLKTFQIPVPPLPEQREVAAQLAALDAKLAAEESRRAALAALFQSLLHELMTGKVRLPEFAGGWR